MRRVVILMAALALISCRIKPGENGERGGEPERQLAQATVGMDVARVRQLLGSGANPNKMAPHEGHDQSPWKLALTQPLTLERAASAGRPQEPPYGKRRWIGPPPSRKLLRFASSFD